MVVQRITTEDQCIPLYKCAENNGNSAFLCFQGHKCGSVTTCKYDISRQDATTTTIGILWKIVSEFQTSRTTNNGYTSGQ